MIDFFDMGGYGGFIWPSYAITFVTLIWLFLASWQRAKVTAKNLKKSVSHNRNTATSQH